MKMNEEYLSMKKTIKKYETLHKKELELRLFKNKLKEMIGYKGAVLIVTCNGDTMASLKSLKLTNNKEFYEEFLKFVKIKHLLLESDIKRADTQINFFGKLID